MDVVVSSQVYVSGYTDEAKKWVDKNLILPNPDFYKKQRMGFWAGSTPRELFLYQDFAGSLVLPFGALRKFLQAFPGQCTGTSLIHEMRPYDYQSHIQLDDYQEAACRKILQKKNGIVVIPCGGGKTQVALEAVARIGGRALWLTHTTELLQQSKKRAKSCFDCDHKSFGTITAGKVQVGESITFATVQTLSKIDLTDLKDAFDIIIADEAQHCAGTPTKVTMFYKILSQLSARYKIGLTATPFRADGLEKSMYAILGDIIVIIPKEQVNRTCTVDIHFIDTGYEPIMNGMAFRADGTIDYAGLVADLTSNEARLTLVSDTINRITAPCLVLASRIDYLRALAERHPGRVVCLSGMTLTKKNREIRDSALAKLNSGEIDCVFATYQLAKEGLDVPNLRYVVFATPEKDPTTVIQSAGRVARKADGKEKGIVIDFVDDFGLFKKYLSKRKSIYKSLNYNM